MAAAGGDAVLGHYSNAAGGAWQPVLAESSPLFKAIVQDASGVEAVIKAEAGGAAQGALRLVLYWDAQAPAPAGADAGAPASPVVNVKQRTLLHLAAYHGSLKSVAHLLASGSDAKQPAPDGLTAHDFANASTSPNKATVLGMLRDAEPLGGPEHHHYPLGPSDSVVPPPNAAVQSQLLALAQQAPLDEVFGGNGDGAYSSRELTRPEYSTDTFRMFCFKVLRCSKRYAHDWRACPFAHPTENARRRDPRDHKYCSVACPDYKQGLCIRGDGCPYAHGIFECWLHPSRYRTQLCKDGGRCRRPVCFFSHAVEELRQPTHQFTPTADDLMRVATWVVLPGSESDGAAGSPKAAGPPGLARHGSAPAAVMGAATAPRMSNAFARRHGLNPKDSPMVNLQKIAAQGAHQQAAAQQAQGGMAAPPPPPPALLPMDAAPMLRSVQSGGMQPGGGRMDGGHHHLSAPSASAQQYALQQALQYQQYLQYQQTQAQAPDILDLAALQSQLSALTTYDAGGGGAGGGASGLAALQHQMYAQAQLQHQLAALQHHHHAQAQAQAQAGAGGFHAAGRLPAGGLSLDFHL